MQESINMMNRFLKAISFVFLVFLVSFPAAAGELYLKQGQSKNLNFKEKIQTIFISDPAVADYKIINEKNIIVYAKKIGAAELTVYGSNSKVLQQVGLNVDPFLGDITQRISSHYPGSQVTVSRFMSADRATYILSGSVKDEATRDEIYQMVGNLVGKEGREEKLEIRDSDGKIDKKPFVSTKIFYNVINRMSLPSSNQVNVKLTIVEVTKEFTDNLGIEWSSLTLNSIIGGGSSVNSAGVFNLLGFKRGFDVANISTFINAIKNDSIARVLAQPNLTVLSGEHAHFLVGGEIPIIVREDNANTIQYKEYGIRLNIGAKVEQAKKIRLFVSNELSSVSGSYAFNDYQIPTIRTRRSSSTIELADGDSFIISGLLTESDRESLTKVPFIGDIPILGALARSARTERNKTELVVFATVNLVKPISSSSSTDKISLPVYQKSGVEKLFFNVKVDKKTRERRLENNAELFIGQGGFAK
jgi:pilus assembly protein CpaC